MAYNVVVVEDEPQVAELLRLILRHAEIEVFTALDGAAGLALIRQVKPQLVVLDIMMPTMNGWELYDAVRSDEALKQTPIIIETVLPERPERKHAFANHSVTFGSGQADLYMSLLNGAAVCLFDIKSEGIQGLPRWLKKEQITIFHSAPTRFW